VEAGLLIDRSGQFGICRPDADLTLDAFTAVVKQSIRRAKRLALASVVVVMPVVKGFPPPTVGARQDMITQWAASAREDMIRDWGCMAASCRIRLVVVVPEHYIDRQRIGVIMAAIQGLTGNVFATEREAIDWLAGPR
jgi:hypothetical protein